MVALVGALLVMVGLVVGLGVVAWPDPQPVPACWMPEDLP
jgi:hypothetical protein